MDLLRGYSVSSPGQWKLPTSPTEHLSSRKPSRLPLFLFSVLVLLLTALIVLLVHPLSSTPRSDAAPISGNIVVAGSTTLQPFVTTASDLFRKHYPDVHFEMHNAGSLDGLNALVKHQADIAKTDVYADPAVYSDPTLTDHVVCVVPLLLVVNLDVPIPSLTHQQIIDIFSTGKLRNWQEVGGPDLPIAPVIRGPTSGSRITFQKYLLDGRDEHGIQATGDGDVRDRVAHTAGGIGYTSLPYFDSSVRTVAIDGVTESLRNITSGRYVFWTYEHLYTLGAGSRAIAAFLDFMLTVDAQQAARQVNFIAMADMKLPGVGTINGETDLNAPRIALHESEGLHYA